MITTLTRVAGPCCLIAFTFSAESGAAADDSKRADPPPNLRHLEKPVDPWRPRNPTWGAKESALAVAGGFGGVQVNVDFAGFNIIGDAANEPSIAIDPTAPNRIVIAWRQFDTIASDFRQAGWGYSHDGGRTWEFPGVIEPGIFRSDPVVDVDLQGRFQYLSLHTNLAEIWRCDLFVSEDAGLTWGKPNFAFGGDKAWFATDRYEGMGLGNLYQAWNTGGNVYFPNQFSRSTDGGLSWSQPVEIPLQPVAGTVAVSVGGEVYVCGIGGGDFIVVRSSNAQDPDQSPTFDLAVTTDLGGTFGAFDGPNPGGLLGQVWVAIDHSGGPTHGNVYLLSSANPPGVDPLDVMFARSEDGGLTWSAPVRVNDDPLKSNAWQWFGTMSVAPNGRIDVIFNDTRNSGLTNISELFYTFSTDAGDTWSANVPVSPSFDSWVGWPNQRKIGDYYDMVSDAVGASVAYAATFNGEQDVYYLRIGDCDCNGNGVPDTEDLLDASGDCNANGIPDECEIAAGTVDDENNNGIPDECEGACPWDLDGSGSVGTTDLLDLLSQWGDNPGGPPDFNGNGNVGTADLLELLSNWGSCPK